MAPLEQRFGVSELPQRVHARLDESGKLKSRKLPGHFDLVKDCQLMELVQYSCTPWQEMMTLQLQGKRQRCWPVVRLFRRCGSVGSPALRGPLNCLCHVWLWDMDDEQ